MPTLFDYIINIVSVILSLTAFLYGVFRLYGKGMPAYFMFLIGAVGCYALEEICAMIYGLCGNIFYNGFQVSTLGTMGCFLFILTAEYGILDKQIKKTEKTKKAGRIAFLAPAFVIVYFGFWVVTSVGTEYLGAAVLTAFVVLPLAFCSYYTLKHLLLSNADDPCIGAVRPCGILLLVFDAANLAFLTVYFFCPFFVISLVSLFLALNISALVLACKKGGSQWKT